MKYYKALIDYLVRLSKDEELMQDLDKIIETYLEVVFKRNSQKSQGEE